VTFLSKLAVWNGMLVWLGLFYYGPQWWPLFAPHELAPTSLDQSVPFLPRTAWIYQSLFLLLPISALLQPTKRAFVRFASGFCLLVICFSAIFWLYPTELLAPNSTLPMDWAYTHLVAGVDGRRNAFPSLHAALTVYAGLPLVALCRKNDAVACGIVLWMLALLISTLTTKQHICADLFGGVTGGLAATVTYFLGYTEPPHPAG
jgi:hypothetical protein